MPRQGDGSSDNAIPKDLNNIIHGAGEEKSTHVDRADKTAPMPEREKGAALEGVDASAGDSKGKDQGGRSTTHA
ncbi:hypothetical protein QBC34DRAFT_334348 [Podospora aff. communis PSN243]|uniref:Uncharacterized protein n=1 Tax=Podospora aff. communis PSN243 TaxID=3040156 RepID=A0AAV9GA20_9PEZI|nr:hypothetical protein QBC34DRAFT_334348 [Podospora aff. communis PSN243]